MKRPKLWWTRSGRNWDSTSVDPFRRTSSRGKKPCVLSVRWRQEPGFNHRENFDGNHNAQVASYFLHHLRDCSFSPALAHSRNFGCGAPTVSRRKSGTQGPRIAVAEWRSPGRRCSHPCPAHGAAGNNFHQLSGEPNLLTRARADGAHFSWISENVDEGSNAKAIHQSFMKSPRHQGNILDSDMDSIGVGVAERNGQLYAVEDFSKAK